MALHIFSGCSGTNNIGDIVISADTTLSASWVVPITLNNTSVSGMCYSWNGTTIPSGTAPIDVYVTSSSQYITKPCSNCNNTYSIRVSGCTGQGTWVIGSDTSPIAGTYEVGSAIHISNSSVLDGCFEVISDGYATQNHLLNGGETITENETGGCTQCEADFPTPTPTPTLTPTQTLTSTPTNTPTPTSTSESTPTPTQTITSTPSTTPTNTPTDLPNCYYGTTDGVFNYVDCCGVVRNGTSIGQQICYDNNYSTTAIIPSNLVCEVDCDNGPLSYTFIQQNTCENSTGGTITILPTGGNVPYSINNTQPGGLTPISGSTGNGPFIYTGLTAGTYTFTLNDSSGGLNQSVNINVNIHGCLTAVISNFSNEACDNNNGSITVSGNSSSLPYTYYIYKDNNNYLSGLTQSKTITINNLDSGTYYAFLKDYGGSTGETQNQIITSGSSPTFGVSVTGSSSCSNNVGSASITGVTGGIEPYSYLWSNGTTGLTATGLTYGTKSVTVFDASGCSKTESFVIPQIPSLSVTSVITTQAACFSNNGAAEINISGGTPPYLYSGDTGQVSGYINDTSYTITGVSGNHTVRILDSQSCDITHSFSVPTTAGFDSVSVNTVDSNCGESGSINISVEGIVTQLTYSITGSTGNTQTFTTTQQNYTFSNLPTDTYQVSVSTENGCNYTTTATINNVNKFFVETQVTGTTCGGSNGSVLINVTSGSTELQLPLDYIISRVDTNQVVSQNIDSPLSAETVNNLTYGTYKLDVTDFNSCTVTKYFTIEESYGISASVQKTNCINSPNTGSATLNIYGGNPPFTITWSDNVNGQEGYSINNLSGGTYTASVTDSDGCSTSLRFDIICNNQAVEGYYINNVCEQNMITTVGNKRSFYSMLNEAFLETSNGNLNCVLDSATFTLNFSLSSSTVSYDFSEEFYTGTTLTDVPSDNLWVTTLDNILSQITELKSYNIDLLNNQYTLVSDCNGDEDPLRGAYTKLELFINMDINCVD